ncbi:MAG: N-acetyl-gamma-glutamyl-phosphate reductase [Candidatus Omnitrophica bacterium]|nr:N-acetyl-gamma-glutamyl-phosphate reductase [Candidatus Omnitrophota bacterium]
MIKVGVIGATGYTGEEIVKILIRHKDVDLAVLQAVIEKEVPISDILPELKGKTNLVCKKPDLEEAKKKAELFFLALPHTVSMKIAPALLEAGKKVIDLSADYRLEAGEYEKWYKTKHIDTANIEKAVYGLPELFREKVKKAHFIANPGCYPTGAMLAIAPLLEKNLIQTDNIICDAKSGITGAGRKPGWNLENPDIKGNFKAYKVNSHQHSPEIDRILSEIHGKGIKVTFVPHLLPLERGILSTVYMKAKSGLEYEKVAGVFREKYKNCPFVRIKPEGEFPQLKEVACTNFFDLGLAVDKSKKLIIAVSAIDNLLKGAAGQAVQNMNIMCAFEETEGLTN